MRGIMTIALAWGTLAPALALAHATVVAQAPPDSVLRQTTAGAIYHAANCAAPDARELLIIYLQGTGLGPEHSKQFLRHVGDRSGQCIVGVPYENTKLVASYCIADSTSGNQDPDCLGQVRGAKAMAIALIIVLLGSTIVLFVSNAIVRVALALIGLGVIVYLLRIPTRPASPPPPCVSRPDSG